jgi:hypothetical protein
MAYFVLESGWPCEVRKFGEEAVDRCGVSEGLDAGDRPVGGFCLYG